MNLKTIADNLATTVGSVTATYGSDTQTLTATADLPDSIDRALLVYPPTGVLSLNVGTQRDDEYEFRLLYLSDPLSVTARVNWLYAWHDALRDKAESNMDLGLSYVQWVRATSSRLELDGELYSVTGGGLKPVDVVEVIHLVKVREFVATAQI